MTLWETMVAALLLGLITVPHCLVMCGPVAALACSSPGSDMSWRDGAGYFAGRLFGYAAVGSVMGWIGAHAFTLLGTDQLGRVVLVALASSCGWHAFRALRPARAPLISLGRSAPRAKPWKALLSALLPRRGVGLGLATAVFPCGALPAAWAIAAASSHPAPGALAMFAFALASTPALVVAVGGRALAERLQRRIHPAIQGACWMGAAAVLLMRAWLLEMSCHG